MYYTSTVPFPNIWEDLGMRLCNMELTTDDGSDTDTGTSL